MARAPRGSRREGVYAYLFVTLTALMVLLPFFGENWAGVVLAFALYTAMIATMRELSAGALPVAITAVLFLFAGWGALRESESVEHALSHAAAVVGYVFVQVAIVRDTLQRSEISLRTVLGASSAYMLTGLMFANVFATVLAVDPNAFHFPDLAPTPQDRHSMLVYLSYITMTTVGYGDVLPLSVPARFLCVAEALFGQLFIAILIARLVGLNASRHAR